MSVVDSRQVSVFELPGITHRTVAGPRQGLKSLEVWVQTMAPGAATPSHSHPCEEVVVILSGSGECTVAGQTVPIGPSSTLVLPPDVVHHIVNTSSEEMRMVAALGMAPARVNTPDGRPLPVPWDAT